MGLPPPDSIDRISPTLRPEGWPAMRQRWAHLLFCHWPVPSADLAPLIPGGLDLDTFDGQAYVGLVAFTMTGVRPVWAPAISGLSNFHEVNVRTYVHRGGRDPGVWFFSLDAANAIAVRIARHFWQLPYHYARMGMTPHVRGASGRPTGWDYRSERLWPGPVPATCRLSYEIQGSPAAARPGTLEHFLAERYLLYTQRGRDLLQGRVYHTPYPIQPATVRELDETLVAAAGISVAGMPPLVHYAAEVRVRVYALKRIADEPDATGIASRRAV